MVYFEDYRTLFLVTEDDLDWTLDLPFRMIANSPLVYYLRSAGVNGCVRIAV